MMKLRSEVNKVCIHTKKKTHILKQIVNPTLENQNFYTVIY